MKSFTLFLFALWSFSVFAQVDQKMANGKWAYYGEEFYKTLEANKRLERFLFEKIFNSGHSPVKGKADQISLNCNNSTCYGHTSVSYDEARKIMFGKLDTLSDNNGTYVLDVYCGQKFYFKNINDVTQMHQQVNIEHTWPQSRFSSKYPKDMQKSDMHHLFLTDSMANNVRGNSPFGLVEEFMNDIGGDGCRNSRHGFSNNMNVYTPPAPHRGNVARALFYFSMHYGLEISISEEKILRQWHKIDPTDAHEIRRHEAIANIQKVRNPFVDYPELADKVIDF